MHLKQNYPEEQLSVSPVKFLKPRAMNTNREGQGGKPRKATFTRCFTETFVV